MNESQEPQQLSSHAEGLMSKLDSAKTAIAQADAAALHAIRNVASTAEDYVRENPWVAIGVIAGVAASVGFLAGYMAAPQRSMMGMLRR